jgi:DtxR family Mn-dependent transcriptional regulator
MPKYIALSSESVEEYLEAIYDFNEKGKLAKTTELAKKLDVSPPSVTEMIKKLAKEGFVEYYPYKGTLLTGKGMANAQKIVRKHRLLERFLYDFLGLSQNKIHDEACRMEHSLSDEAAAALCKALESPKISPEDGKKIPCPFDNSDQCEIVRDNDIGFKLITELSNLKPGEEGTVTFIRGGNRAHKRLLDLGLTQGTKVKMLNSAPFRGPVKVEVRDTNLALGRGLARHVLVELKNNLSPQKRIHVRKSRHRRGR